MILWCLVLTPQVKNSFQFIAQSNFPTKSDMQIWFKCYRVKYTMYCLVLYTVACVKFNYGHAVQPLWATLPNWRKHRPGGDPAGSTQHWAHCPGPRPWDGPLPSSYITTHNTVSRSRHTGSRARSTLMTAAISTDAWALRVTATEMHIA